MSNPYIGEIRIFAFNFAPVGWAMCNGQLLPISQNTALFSLLGTYYGGDGIQTFALPNLQSRVPKHIGQGQGLQPYVIGQLGGSETETLTVNQMPIHTHPVACTAGIGTQTSPNGGFPAIESTGTSMNYGAPPSTGTMSPGMIGTAGGSQPFVVLDPYLCVNFCIALQGIYPSRN